MPRVYLPLLPIPVLAVIVAVSACSRPRSDERVTHVIPPPAPYAAPANDGRAPPAVTSDTKEEAPSDDEVKAFERPVAK